MKQKYKPPAAAERMNKMSEYKKSKLKIKEEYVDKRKKLEGKVVEDLLSILKFMIDNKGKLFSPEALSKKAKILSVPEITSILYSMWMYSPITDYGSRFYRDEYYYYNKIRSDIRKMLPSFRIEKERVFPSTITIVVTDSMGNNTEIKKTPSKREKEEYSRLFFRAV